LTGKIPKKYSEKILGVQFQLWSEYISTSSHMEYMAFPRACALSEVAWSPGELRKFDEFSQRLLVHLQRLDVLNVNYRKIT